MLISEAVRSKVVLRHPDNHELAFLYGTIVTDGDDVFSDKPTVNLTVFADREVIIAILEQLCRLFTDISVIN